MPVAAIWGVVNVCTVQSGVDYKGGERREEKRSGEEKREEAAVNCPL